MDSICVVIRKAPYGSLAAAEGVRHLLGAAGCGMAASAVLVDDGVFLAKHGQDSAGSGWVSLSAALQKALDPAGAGSSPQIRVHRPSLEQRGITHLELVSGVGLIDDEELAAILAAAERLLIF